MIEISFDRMGIKHLNKGTVTYFYKNEKRPLNTLSQISTLETSDYIKGSINTYISNIFSIQGLI